MRFFFLYVLLVVGIAGPGKASADPYTGYCDSAVSTADILNCVRKYHNDMQTQLNDIFKKVSALQEGKYKDALSESQKSWLAYRDLHCAWEAALAPKPSLVRVYELSCLAELTESRVRVLSAVLSQETESVPREFGSRPRWINVLLNNYPGVYWDYSRWVHVDLNCDGVPEEIVTGVNFIEDGGTQEGDGARIVEKPVVVLAVLENPVTGKPEAHVSYVPVKRDMADGEENKTGEPPAYVCRSRVDLAVVGYPHPGQPEGSAPAEAGDEAPTSQISDKISDENAQNKKIKSCRSALRIIDNLCNPLALYWTGEKYTVEFTEIN